ncbi:MAG: glycosyltransferase family protein [Alphaproteobacteria bacterium]
MTGMRILYGIQATGNGHLSRAKTLVPKLRERGAEVTCVISGRNPEDLSDFPMFEPFIACKGLSFVSKNGKISYHRTAFNSQSMQFIKDFKNLDLEKCDLILTDYEPITAHAARSAGKRVIGLGNHNSLLYDLPDIKKSPALKLAMKYFAPLTTGIGLHWNNFGHPILPPMVSCDDRAFPADPTKILVYMDGEEREELVKLFSQFPDYKFHLYSSKIKAEQHIGNVIVKPVSQDGSFQRDLQTCAGVVCGAGFELPSEALYLGKKLLIKLLDRQPEQFANAQALKNLGYAGVLDTLDPKPIRKWLKKDHAPRIVWGDTANVVADWIVKGANPDEVSIMVDKLWQDTKIYNSPVPVFKNPQTQNKKLDVETILISDMHFPKRVARADLLLEFLETMRAEAKNRGKIVKKLVLMGDILDGWYRQSHKHKKGKFSEMQMRVMDCINAMAAEGTEIFYLGGNHDENLRKVWHIPERLGRRSERGKPKKIQVRSGTEGGARHRLKILGETHHFIDKTTGKKAPIHIANHHIHFDAQGRRCFFMHGDQLDPKALKMGVGDLLSHRTDSVYDYIIEVERFFRGDASPGKISAFVKENAKRIFNVQSGAKKKIEKILAIADTIPNKPKSRPIDVFAGGHLHQAELLEKDGKVILNSGDWVDSCTGIINGLDGWQLIEWRKMRKEFGFEEVPTKNDDNPNRAYRAITEQQLRWAQRIWPAKNQEKLEHKAAKARQLLSEIRVQTENASMGGRQCLLWKAGVRILKRHN